MFLKRRCLATLFLVASCLVPRPTRGWCYLEGFALGRGKRLYLVKAKTGAECAKACGDVALCTHWTFDRGKSYCLLRTEDSAETVLIRKQDDAISATEDCSQAISLATGGSSCFADAWTVVPVASDLPLSVEHRTSPLLLSESARSAEDCQTLCQKSAERCSVWEWDVLTEQCTSWEAPLTLRRQSEIPLGFSVYTYPFEEESEEFPGKGKLEVMRQRLQSMKTVVGPPSCSHALLADSRETTETASRATRCSIPIIRQVPWIVPTGLTVGQGTNTITQASTRYDGLAMANQNTETISSSHLMSTYFNRAPNSITQLKNVALRNLEFTYTSVGVDSSTVPLKTVTDRVSSPQDCQSLCKSLSTCKMFTFYIDGRAGGNCVLKPAVYLRELVVHPFAVTGSKTETTSLALRGMKFGYEMKGETMAAPQNYKMLDSKFLYEYLFTNAPFVEEMARQSCYLLGEAGYAVLDYLSFTAHAVAARGAKERFMPNFNYIDCSKVN